MKIITLNIEGDSHLNKVIPFLKSERPDVVCLQEAFEVDLELFKQELGLEGFFVPTCVIDTLLNPRLKPKGKWGIAMITNNDLMKFHWDNYHIETIGNEALPRYITTTDNVGNKAYIVGSGMFENKYFKIITTHCSVSPNGCVTELQRSQMSQFLSKIRIEREYVLCGDFNTPRGGGLWNELSGLYRDNIPVEILTTIDNVLHQRGSNGKSINFVVDGLFSTPCYTVSSVKVQNGVSDHCAIIGNVSRF